ncbi:MAG TPA: zinc ribbon domain-containing protein [Ktedonobacterales bacterium]|jgi:putative FmdB family regulatory protein
MPIYEYYCKDCRNRFELLTTYTESEVDIECSKCHGANVRKLFSVFARTRGGGGDFGDSGDFGDGDDYGDDDGEYMSGGSCACGGGACGCND